MTDLLIAYQDTLPNASSFDTSHTLEASAFSSTSNLLYGSRARGIRLATPTADDFIIHSADANTPADSYRAYCGIPDLGKTITAASLRRATYSFNLPLALPNLVAWWDIGRGMVYDGSNNIQSWTDSYSSATLTQTLGARPLFTARDSLGYTPLTFDGSTNISLYNQTYTGLQSKSAFTAVIVVNNASSAGGRIVNNYSDDNFIFRLSGGNMVSGVDNANYGSAAASTNQLDYYVLFYFGAGATNADRLQRHKNGAQETLSFTGTIPATTSATAGLLFGNRLSASAGYNGKIYEFILFSSALSGANVGILNNWLASKYSSGTSVRFIDNDIQGQGPSEQDFIKTFSGVGGVYYWLRLGTQVSGQQPKSRYEISKMFSGTTPFDFGRNPIWGRGVTQTVFHRGEKRPRYTFDFRWEGITNAKVQEFEQYIGRKIDIAPVILYTTGYHEILHDLEMLHCKIVDFTITPELHNDNTVEITFEELL